MNKDRDLLLLNKRALHLSDRHQDYDEQSRGTYDADARVVKWLKDVLADEGAGRKACLERED